MLYRSHAPNAIRSGGGSVVVNANGSITLTPASGQGIGIGGSDVLLHRAAANTLALRNSTNAQNFWVYNRYADASNYEYAGIGWASNVLTISTVAAGTGAARSITIKAADGSSASGAGVSITAGTAVVGGSGVAGNGGSLTFTTGSVTNPNAAAVTTGNLNFVVGGSTGGTNAADITRGNVSFTWATASGWIGAQGGSFTVTLPTSIGNSYNGPAITMTAGGGAAITGTGGAVTLTAGAGGSAGAGGAASLISGAGGSSSGNSGNVTLRSGAVVSGTAGSLLFQTNGANTRWSIDGSGMLTAADGMNLAVGTTTGTKIGTATTQKIGFYNATPVVQGAAVADASGGATIDVEARTALNALLARIRSLGLIAT